MLFVSGRDAPEVFDRSDAEWPKPPRLSSTLLQSLSGTRQQTAKSPFSNTASARKDRDSLFTFMTERGVPPTNNGSERDIRPSTVFRKVTNGFRSDWGSDLYAGVRSTLNTGRRQGLSAFQAIQAAINGEPLLRPG